MGERQWQVLTPRRSRRLKVPLAGPRYGHLPFTVIAFSINVSVLIAITSLLIAMGLVGSPAMAL